LALRIDTSVLGPSDFRELVSGRRQGAWAAAARALLSAAEVPYTAAVRWRNARYDRGRAAVARLSVPVVSVGNITLGGTGKTPAVEWLARWFTQRGVRVGIVSRGYGSRAGRPNDEALELAQKLPDVPHVQDPDRVRGGQRVIDEFGCQLILLDDGFQHRRLARDLDIVLIDALEPTGFDHVFPRGTLREPLTGWQRAGVLMLTRAELLEPARRSEVQKLVQRYAAGATWVESTFAAQSLRAADGAERPLTHLAGIRLASFCGIGNPAGFYRLLAQQGYVVIGQREFADHFAYTADYAQSLAAWAADIQADAVVCTAKDLVKIGPLWPPGVPLWAVTGRLELLSGQAPLQAQLEPLAARALSATRA